MPTRAALPGAGQPLVAGGMHGRRRRPSRGACSIEAGSIGVDRPTTCVRSPSSASATWFRCCKCRGSSARSNPRASACLQVVQSDTGTPYRDAPEARVLILGDSFLRIYERDEPGAAGFIAHLARELGQPLTSIVNDGGASTLVRQELARRPELLANKRLVIWEFAERDIRYGTEGWQILPLSHLEDRSEVAHETHEPGSQR